MSTPAGDGQIGDATITVNANTTAAALAIRGLTRDVNGNLRDMRGRFVSESRLINNSLNTITGGSDRFKAALGSLKSAALLLSPALIPIAAAAAPIAASVGAAAIAVGAFSAAAAGQIVAISEASEAEKKYTDAVTEHGKASKEATEAEKTYLVAVQKLPPATRQAAAGLSVLKDGYKAWSDSLAGDTMPVATKSFAVFGAVFPKLTPIVKGAAGELNRFMTIVAGGIQSPSFDRFMASFAEFSTGALAKANDGLIRLTRTLDTGKIGGGLSEFMAYAKENGPLVGDTLKNVAQALTKLLIAGSEVGVGLLTVINAFTSLIAAVPTGLITNLLQVAIAFKAVKLAAAGFSAVSAGLLAMTAQVTAMRTAAGAATGRMAALGAAIGVMSRGMKLAVAGTGIGLLLIALTELSQMGKAVPPNVDRLTTALGKLGQTGKVTGEAAKVFGADFGKLRSQIDKVTNPSVAESINNWGADVTNGLLSAGEATEEVTGSFKAIDESLTNLVRGGKAGLAGAALANMLKGMNPEQVEKLTGSLGDYDAALADMAFEQKLAADAMGLFGAQAQAVQAKLNAQKQSTDGLRQSIHALSDAYIMARGGVRGMEAAIDAARVAFAENGKALNLTTAAGRANNEALDNLATATKRAAEAARDNGSSWETVNGILSRGRGEFIKVADQMGLNRQQAKKLADQIIGVPLTKTSLLRGDMTDLQQKLTHAKNQLARVPDSRKAEVRARIEQLEAALRRARGLLNGIDGKVAKTYVVTYHSDVRLGGVSNPGTGGPGGFPKGAAQGGLIGYPHGGPVRGTGTSTSDSILTALSNGEFVIRAAAVRHYGAGMFAALNALQTPLRAPGRGGMSAAALGVGATRTGSGGGSVVITNHFHLENRGVIGSQREAENWLIGSMDRLRLQGRLPMGTAA